jgi:hypothetical protein
VDVAREVVAEESDLLGDVWRDENWMLAEEVSINENHC